VTDEQINAAIAEACNWGVKPVVHIDDKGIRVREYPDYCSDLNAMHEAEKVLTTFDEWDIYCVHLGDTQPSCAKATARQRAEAFLHTLGKWEAATEDSSVDHFRDATKKVKEVQP
jgi:hypothetical protein